MSDTEAPQPRVRKSVRAKPPDVASDEAGREVLTALRRIIRAIDLQSKQTAKVSGLTTAQLVVLQAIDELGEVTTGRLSAEVSLSQATVTTILDRLEYREMIERYRSTRDRRVVHERLTAKGRRALKKAPPLLHQRFIELFSELGRSEQTDMIATLDQIAVMLGAGTLDAAPLLAVDHPTGAH